LAEQTLDPSEAEIAAACRRIQSRWTDEVRRARAVGGAHPASVMTINALELGAIEIEMED
jgi:hypothetical protein